MCVYIYIYIYIYTHTYINCLRTSAMGRVAPPLRRVGRLVMGPWAQRQLPSSQILR